MINEVFIIEIDKNGQILALDFGCLEIFFQMFDLCLPVNQFLSSVTESAVGN